MRSTRGLALVLASIGAVGGCRGDGATSPAPLKIEAVRAALNASPKTSDFIFEAGNSIVLHSSPLTVNGGDLAARGVGTVGPFLSGGVAIDISSGAVVQTTHNVIADSIRLNSGIKVGDLQTNRLVNPSSGTHGSVTALVPLPALPALASVSAGTANLTVAGGKTVTASPGQFLTVSLGTNAVLRLNAGTYQVKDLTIGTGGRVEALGAVQIRVANRLNAGSSFFIGACADTSLTAKDVRLEVSGVNGTDGALASTPKAAVLSSGGTIRALVLAPNGTLAIASNVTAKGAFMARDIDVGSSSSAYTFEDGFASTVTCTAQSCNDNNPCTTDTCGANGVCVHANVAAGTSCGDGNACNGAETCNASGVCQSGAPVTCVASDQCHAAGTCDPATGACSNPAKADGTSCNDGKSCTSSDVCTAGVCAGTVACAPTDQCHGPGACAADGTCTNPAKADGTSCDDHDACTNADTCQAGACKGGSPVTCVAADQCHVAGSCDSSTGACTNPPAQNGTPCNDGDFCTQTDACVAGACVGTNPVTCAAQDQCHVVGLCNPTTGQCSNPAMADGTTCDDHDQCTTAEACHAGVCGGGTAKTCTAQDDCHVAGVCNPASGTCSNPAVADGTTCDDHDLCTTAEACHAGVCNGGTAKTCTALDQCHVAGVCDPANGTCSNPAAVDGTTCDDGKACTTADACHAGTCGGSETCPASDQCHAPGTCAADGTCTNPTKADGATCDDNNPATTADQCRVGVCAGIAPCPVSDQCHGPGTRDPVTGVCSAPLLPNGTSCDDGNSCTSGDVCTTGVCAGTGSCSSSVTASWEFTGGLEQPSLPISITPDRPAVRPGDVVNLTVQVAFDGVQFMTNGRLDIANTGTSAFVVPGYSVTAEYLSTISQEWVPVARLAFDANGQQLPPSTSADLAFSAYAPFIYDWMSGTGYYLPTPGVTYADGRMAGTTINPGSTAISDVNTTFVLPPDVLAILADPAQSQGLRQVVHLDAGPGLPNGADVVTPFATPPSGDLVITDLSGGFYFNGSQPLSPATVPSLHMGSGVTFTGSAAIDPLLPFSVASQQYQGYRGYLSRLVQNTFDATAWVNGTTADFPNGAYSSASSPTIPMLVPIVDPTVVSGTSSPMPAGFPQTVNLALKNSGTEAASNIVLKDLVRIFPSDFTPVTATINAPTTVAAGATQNASMVWTTPGDHQDNVDSLGEVTWQDGVGNTYGPLRSPSWYDHLNEPLPLGAITLAGQPTGPLPVETPQALTATAVDTHGVPVAGVAVQLTVTGVNAQVLSAQTDGSGVAHFSYTGHLPGGDTLVASGTITTGPTTSNSQEIFWSAAYGHCTSPDAPLDVAIVIDTSSSMEGAQLEGAKAAARAFLNTMDLSRDQLAVVSFGGVSTLNSQLTSDFAQAAAGIDGVEPGGGFINPTNIGAGLWTALDELTSARARPTATPIIVFVSDGGNSFGDPEPALARLKASGIRTFAFGLGSDADFVMLQRIASSKNEFFYVPTTDELGWVYGNLRRDICRNQVPLVHSGGDQGAYGVRLPHSLELHGEVHDDGPVEMLTSEWTFVSGPAPVTFVDASSPDTVAFFAEPGTYVVRLTASDGELTGSADATITVDPEPSLVGANLVTTLGTPGPLIVGSPETVLATLTDASGHPIDDFAVQVTVTGPNATTATVLTNASGVATFPYTGSVVGTDVITATALSTTPVASAPVSLSWTGLETATVATQGWIGSPLSGATLTDRTPIIVGDGVTLTDGTVTFWPASAPDRVRTIATGVTGGPGSTIALLDTTVLANGPYIVKLEATNDQGVSEISLVGVTVGGEYKPGRVVVEVTDFTMPVAGMPITLGRRYDSLEKDNVGEFGNGWSLTMAHPRLEVDAFHNVTITMPDGRRQTFYFTPTLPSVGPVILGFFALPKYTSEPGLYGSLTTDGCSVLAFNPYADVPNPTCFGAFDPSDLAYSPTTYQYTDAYGTVYTMGASGELRSVKDRQQNELTFTHDGIVSSTGRVLAFERDALNRITKVTSPPLDLGNGKIIHQYEYDAAGNLSKVDFPDNTNAQYTYGDHLLLTSKDNNGNMARTSTYDDFGHLMSDKDALGNVTSYAYDFAGHKTTITNPDLGTIEQTFDERGLLLEEIDPLGRKTEHTYDANKNEITRKNALGEVRTFTYDALGNQTSNTNARGEAMRRTFNDVALPIAKTDPTGHTTTTEYDSVVGVPKRISDELGTIATITSSEHGLVVSTADAIGNSAFLTYDAYGSLTSKTDRLGRVTRYTFDGAGRQTSTTPPRGGATSFTYSARGSLTFYNTPTGIFAQSGFAYAYDGNLNRTVEDSHMGRRANRTFDALNHLTRVDRDDFTTVSYTHDFRGNALTYKDESGRTTTYEYDKVGQLKKTTFPDGTYKSRDYDDLGRLVKETDERGNATSYEYQSGCDCSDRITKITDPLGRTNTMTYDAAGRRSSITDPAGHTTSYEYDVRGHLTKTTYADGTFERDTYDTRNRRTSHIDPMGAVTTFDYDAAGQLLTVTDSLSHVTHYTYDDNGNLASVTDANNRTTTYEYDLKNHQIKQTMPNGASESFAYDLFDEVTSHVDFGGKTTTTTYDRRGRVLSRVPDPTLSEPTVTFTYNPTGTRASMVDASGTTTYTYDTRDRMLTKATQAGTLTYTFDAAGNVGTVRSSNANGTSLDYAWDAANQLVSVTDNRGGGVTTSAYTPTGRPSTLSQPTGIAASYQYDARDRVTSLSWQHGADPAVTRWSYGFNARGQRTSVTNGANRQIAYGYDAAARLVSETITNDPQSGGNGQISYTLDPVGNRLNRTSTLAALATQSFTYDGNNQIATDGYDANGNTTTADGHTFKYDFENRLVSKDAGAVTVVYDGDGSRVAKTVGGVTTHYLVDDLSPTRYSQVLEEVSGGSVQVAYTYGTKVVSQRRGSVASYYGYDAHGNIAFLTDGTGNVTDAYEYDAWGNLLGQSGTTINTRQYTGEEVDPDLGVIYLRARHYDPTRGRFTTADTFPSNPERPVTFNPYLYADGDPVDHLDPSGHVSAAEYAIIWTGVVGVAFTWYNHNVAHTDWLDYCAVGGGVGGAWAANAMPAVGWTLAASAGWGVGIFATLVVICVEIDLLSKLPPRH